MKVKKEVKKYRPDEVFRRTPSGKYHPIGYEWTGFPMDGIWLVQNGTNCASCLIGLKEKVPIFALNYRVHEKGVVDAIQKMGKEKGGLSMYDMARTCCDYFAHVAGKQVEK